MHIMSLQGDGDAQSLAAALYFARVPVHCHGNLRENVFVMFWSLEKENKVQRQTGGFSHRKPK